MRLIELLRETPVLDLGPLPAPTLAPTATVAQAIDMLARGRRGAVVAIEGTKPVGIFTDRDAIERLTLEPGDAGERRLLLRDRMSAPPVTIRRQSSLHDAVELMVRGRYRHVVVVDRHGDLRGLLTSGDLIQHVTDLFPESVINLPPRLHQVFKRAEGG
jgi:CBS domain-containing protein